MADLPAIMGGEKLPKKQLPLTQPTMPPIEGITKDLAQMYETRMLTNSAFVKRFEDAVVARVGCAHAVAISSCTSGLMMALSMFKRRGGTVVLPTYTFSATGHAVAWNGMRMRPVDVDPETFLVDVDKVQDALAGRSVAAVIAVHLFGLAAPVDALRDVCEDKHVTLIYDAAHALGARSKGRPIGAFGTAEVFSLSPTKVVVAGEGGIVTTNDRAVADRIRLGRNYGDDGTGVCQFSGLNARMSEVHASIAYHSLEHLDENLEWRRLMVRRLRGKLSVLPGLTFQRVDDFDSSTFKDFGVQVDPDAFGLTRDELKKALAAEGIATKTYFDPPIHRQPAFKSLVPRARLPVAERLASRMINLPLYSHMTTDDIDTIARAVERIHANAPAVRAALK